MEKGKISIIIPIYNAEKTIKVCLESVLNQSYKNIEVILVDDGSKDNSRVICEEYGKKDKRVIVLHKRNGGASSARNYGLKFATGEFIGFVDSDDFIDLDMYESLFSEMTNDVDIVTCGRYIAHSKIKKKSETVLFTTYKCTKLGNLQGIEEWLKHKKFSYAVWDKLYRKELFMGIQFPEGRVCEDIIVSYLLMKKSRNTINIGKPKYHKYMRRDSVSNSSFYYRRIDFSLFLGEICRDVQKDYPDYIELAEALYVDSLVHILKEIYNSPNKNEYERVEKRFRKALRHFVFRVSNNEYISPEKKIEYWNEIFRV